MPGWNGLPLFSDASGARYSGAVLGLTGAASEARFLDMGDASAQVSKGSSDLIIRLSAPMSAETVLDAALFRGSAALDLLAADGGPFVTVGLRPDMSLTWWTAGSKRVARIEIRHPLAFRFSCSATAVDANGNPLPQPPPQLPVLHESMRYYRLSQCTDDLFDAFRNGYLALESALVDLCPIVPGEREGQWLRRAFRAALAVTDLQRHLGCTVADAPRRFHDDIYKAVRCPLFHGKAMGLDPGSLTDRAAVQAAYLVVVKSYVAIARTRYRLRLLNGGGLTEAGFAGLETFMDDWAIQLGPGTDEHNFGPLMEMLCTSPQRVPERIRRLGTQAAPFGDALADTSFVAAFHEGEMAFWHHLGGSISPDELDALEVLLDLWNSVDEGFRERFPG